MSELLTATATRPPAFRDRDREPSDQTAGDDRQAREEEARRGQG